MSLLDGILKNIGGAPDDIAGLAAKIGIDPAMAEKAVAALGMSHAEEGDTVELAAKKTGLDTGALGGILEQLGGENALSQLSEKLGGDSKLGSMLSMADKDGDGNPVNDLLGMAKGLFGKK